MWQKIFVGLPGFPLGIPFHLKEGDTTSKFMHGNSAHVALSRRFRNIGMILISFRFLFGSGVQRRWWRHKKARSLSVVFHSRIVRRKNVRKVMVVFPEDYSWDFLESDIEDEVLR